MAVPPNPSDLESFLIRLRTGLVLGGAALFYIAFLPRFYVGFFNDDALYILAARSLLQGSYRTLYVPRQPPNIHFLPGYPLFLAPFTALVAPHWAWLKITGVLLMMGILFFHSKLLQPWVAPGLRWLLTAVVAIHPLMALFSGVVMSDPCYLFGSLAVFLIFQIYLRSGEKHLEWSLVLLIAWTSLIRPIGAVLIPAVPLGLYFAGRRSAALRVGGLSLGLWGLFMLRNYFIGHVPTDYFSEFHRSVFAVSDSFADMGQRLARTLKNVMEDVFIGWPVPNGGIGYAVAAFLGCVSLGLVLMGARRLTRLGKEEKGFAAALLLFLLAHVLVQGLWTTATDRYFLPFVPYLWLFIGLGAESLGINRRRGLLLLLGIPALAYICKDAQLLQETYSPTRPAISLLPRESLAWIREQTPRDALFLGKAPMIYLYTGRQGYSATPATTPEEFVRALEQMGIRYIWWQPRPLLSVSGPLSINQQQRLDLESEWTASSPRFFKRVYLNPQEKIAIYSVIPSAKGVLK